MNEAVSGKTLAIVFPRTLTTKPFKASVAGANTSGPIIVCNMSLYGLYYIQGGSSWESRTIPESEPLVALFAKGVTFWMGCLKQEVVVARYTSKSSIPACCATVQRKCAAFFFLCFAHHVLYALQLNSRDTSLPLAGFWTGHYIDRCTPVLLQHNVLIVLHGGFVAGVSRGQCLKCFGGDCGRQGIGEPHTTDGFAHCVENGIGPSHRPRNGRDHQECGGHHSVGLHCHPRTKFRHRSRTSIRIFLCTTRPQHMVFHRRMF